MIAFGVCVGNEEAYERVAKPSILALAEPDTVLLSSTQNDSIFHAYNEMLEQVRDLPDLEALILLHEDVELRDPSLLWKVRTCFAQPNVGVVGVVGATGVPSLEWWKGDGKGRCPETRMTVDFGGGTHEVEAVDGLFMAVSPWVTRNVSFDEGYSGFHGYDLDYCFSARKAGAHVIVTEIDLFHHTKGGLGDEAAFHAADLRFCAKWARSLTRPAFEPVGTADASVGTAFEPVGTATSDRPGLEVAATPPPADRPSTTPGTEGLVHIDLGGGKIPRPGWVNLDPVHGAGDWRRPAQQTPWPAADGSAEAIFASHVMEHIPAGAERIAVMNEAWRVLRPGGTFEIRVPLFPRWEAIADPTHVSFWVPQSFLYFTGQLAADADYGIAFWELESCVVADEWELRGVLRKPSP